MRKLIVFNQVSLDGYFAGTNSNMSWARKDNKDAERNAFVRRHQRETDPETDKNAGLLQRERLAVLRTGQMIGKQACETDVRTDLRCRVVE